MLNLCLISHGFFFPGQDNDNDSKNDKDIICMTTLGSKGHCLDIHLCPIALNQIAKEGLYPKICKFEENLKEIEVCCPDQEDQCGLEFPVDDGFER